MPSNLPQIRVPVNPDFKQWIDDNWTELSAYYGVSSKAELWRLFFTEGLNADGFNAPISIEVEHGKYKRGND